MIKLLESVADATDRGTKIFVILLLAAMVVIITFEILFQYVLTIPMVWPEQLVSNIMIWMAYLSAAIAFRHGAYMGMTLLSSRLPEKLRIIVGMLSIILVVIFLIILSYWGIRYAYDVREKISPVVFNISMIWPYLALSVGTLLMIIQNLKVIVSGFELIQRDSDILSDSI